MPKLLKNKQYIKPLADSLNVFNFKIVYTYIIKGKTDVK